MASILPNRVLRTMNETAAIVDDLRKAIVEYEARIAKGRRQYLKSPTDAMQTQALLESTLHSLKRTLQHIEKSHKLVATSHALLEATEQNERRWPDQARSSQEASTLRLPRPIF